ncbi:MAG: SAM-dependent methyltransferase [Deltaproteobacteria bacterium]|nr:SAM-dependent methyltransferase [Deltaproteobacteria bacterium]
MRAEAKALGASFRDPSGFMFRANGNLYRQVNESYADQYRALMESGLYEALVAKGVLVSHEEASIDGARDSAAHKILKPALIPFISYPYEWSFSELKQAALLTLEIQEMALARGMVLKDASAYNVQFLGSKPIFIDTLSFEKYVEGTPWVAYQQFCQHFLAPLALMSFCDVRLAKLLKEFINGVPLDLTSSLLPMSTWLKPGIVMHVHLHARSQNRHADDARKGSTTARRMSLTGLRGLIDHLKSVVSALTWKPGGTEWADYYEGTNYNDTARSEKANKVAEYIAAVAPHMVWDFGANNGEFSKLAAERGAYTVAFDIDASAVEKNYLREQSQHSTRMLPLILDLTNPSPNMGWAHEERLSTAGRGPADLALALALVHHLAISNNVPLDRVSRYFASCCKALVIEFVPKEDSQVIRLLASRKDVFPHYTQADFEAAFSEDFVIERSHRITDSHRTLYLMRKK